MNRYYNFLGICMLIDSYYMFCEGVEKTVEGTFLDNSLALFTYQILCIIMNLYTHREYSSITVQMLLQWNSHHSYLLVSHFKTLQFSNISF